MIQRVVGVSSTQSRSVTCNGLVTTVAVSSSKDSSLFVQSCNALAAIESNLADAGTTKARILTAMVYITEIRNKSEFNRAWETWVDRSNPPLRACFGVTLEGEDLIEIVVTAEI